MRPSRLSLLALLATLLASVAGCALTATADDDDFAGGKADDGRVGPQDGRLGITKGTSEQTINAGDLHGGVCVTFVAEGQNQKETLRPHTRLFGLVERKNGEGRCPFTSKLGSPLHRTVVVPDASLASLSDDVRQALRSFGYRSTAYLSASAKREATFMEVVAPIDWKRIVGDAIGWESYPGGAPGCVLYVQGDDGAVTGLVDTSANCQRTDHLDVGTRVTVPWHNARPYESDDQYSSYQGESDDGVEYRELQAGVVRVQP